MRNVLSLVSIFLVSFASLPLYARSLTTANRTQPQPVAQKPADPLKPAEAQRPVKQEPVEDKAARTSALKRFRELANKCDAKAKGGSPEATKREGEEHQ